MANGTTLAGNTIKIHTFDGSDWTLAVDLPDYADTGLKVKAIRFIASGANDIMIIREGSLTGPEIFHANANDFAAAGEDHREEYGSRGTWMFPFIEADDITLGTAANAIVIFELA
jgi:hypothetical protein